MISVAKGKLGQPVHIAQGGVATVHRVTQPVAGLGPPPYAFKEFRTDITAAALAAAAAAAPLAVGMREALTPTKRALLDSFAVWPQAVVLDGGRVVGLLMPLIGDDFFITGNAGSRVFEFQFLCAGDAWRARMGYDLSAADEDVIRLSLMAQLAYAISTLHEFGWVYGDLSLRNAAIATNPPRILLMDCDGVARLSDTLRTQLTSPFFDVPEILNRQQTLQDTHTDVYKLALCVIRGLARGNAVPQLKDPAPVAAILGPDGLHLLTAALNHDRQTRPSARQIADGLATRAIQLRAGEAELAVGPVGALSPPDAVADGGGDFGEAGDYV